MSPTKKDRCLLCDLATLLHGLRSDIERDADELAN